MLWKRQIPILIVALIGSITLFGWFINEPNVKEFVGDDATQWYDILASFAIILGALNLIKLQIQKVLYKKVSRLLIAMQNISLILIVSHQYRLA